MKVLKIYSLIKKAYDDFDYLVNPIVKEDIRQQRSKLLEAIKIIEESDYDIK